MGGIEVELVNNSLVIRPCRIENSLAKERKQFIALILAIEIVETKERTESIEFSSAINVSEAVQLAVEGEDCNGQHRPRRGLLPQDQ
tara:strand:- start:212192 stop:212452 length:261 start_codon:yes stop_codon:yes gene_type:complete